MVTEGLHPVAARALAWADSLFPEDEPSSLDADRGSEALLDHIRRCCAFGTTTAEWIEDGIPYLVNEFWTAGQRQAHSIHEVSYRACFKPQLPAFFIGILTQPGEIVFDPFMGRGTTPIQAALMGRRPAGADINPLSVLLTRPRLTPPTLMQVAERLRQINWQETGEQPSELLAFYHPQTLAHLSALKRWIEQQAPLKCDDPDPVVDWIRMVAINRLSGHSPGFFSGRSMPPNQAVSVKSQLRINEKLGVRPPRRDVSEIIIKKTRTLLADGTLSSPLRPILAVGGADAAPQMQAKSVSLIVTSPLSSISSNMLRTTGFGAGLLASMWRASASPCIGQRKRGET